MSTPSPSPLSRLGARLRRLRLRILRHRRPLAAVVAGLAVWLGVQAATAPASPTIPVWTAAADLEAGAVLGASDLQATGFLEGTVPSSAITDPAEVIGRPLTHAVDRGQPLAATMVLGERWLAAQGGATVVPVRISDAAVVDLLRVGDEVDLHATPMAVSSGAARADQAAVLVEDARVVALPPPPEAGDPASLPGRLVLLAVPAPSVGIVTSAAARHYVSVSWSR